VVQLTAQEVSVTLTGVGLALAVTSAFFPLWRSRSLSPDVIMRRLFWTGTVVTMVFSFLAIWPDWKVGLFASLSLGLFLLVAAVRYTSHLRFRGRIYGHPHNRGPDRPPSRAPKD
jgi:hypothetical protein